MSPRKHAPRRGPSRPAAVVWTLTTCLLLSGCFGSGGQEPTASHHTRHDSGPTGSTGSTGSTQPTQSTQPTDPTDGTSSPPAPSLLRFSPKSDGRHSHDCLALHPGDDPAEFLYYPVLVRASSQVDLDSVTTDHSGGVVVAGSWVAPAAATPSTGTLPGWPPPKIFTASSNVRWSDRVPAAGATLEPSTGWYNVFLRIQVDPTPGDSTMTGVRITYHDADASHTDIWVDHVTFSMSC